jgi:DmsE family decaheme c-type cytochrome
MPIKRIPKSLLFTVLVILALTVATAVAAADKTKSTDQETKYVRPSDPSLYVGEETCKTCHEDMPSKGFYKAYEDSPHFATTLDTKKGPEWHGCEACHGPGKAHVEGGGDKTKIFTFKGASTAQISARCLDCHQYGEEHSNFARSAHLQNNVACTDCHDPHHAKESQFLLIKAQPELCYACHAKMKAQFNMPFHHRVEEGLVKCADCHNPHGGFIGKQLRSAAARDSVCFTCHVDKQGPFVFEHQPVKTEGCVSCHSPHGSPNPHLIKTSNLNILCLKCHTASSFSGASGTPDFHNQAAQYQACTICHMAIHGSNFDRHFLK